MNAAMHRSSLQGRAIMVVEDEYLQADDLARAFTDAGAKLVGPFPSPEAAIAAIEGGQHVDAAVLDINLRGVMADGVADLLASRGISFLFATGYGSDQLPTAHRNRQVFEKPFRLESLVDAVADLCN